MDWNTFIHLDKRKYIALLFSNLFNKLRFEKKKLRTPLFLEKPEYIGKDLVELQGEFPDCEIYEFNDGGLKYMIQAPNESGALIMIFDHEFKCIQSNFYHKEILSD